MLPEIRITLGPRPGKKSVKALQAMGFTHCCTLLSAREDAELIARVCRSMGTDEAPVEWVWMPIEGGNINVLRQTDVAALVVTLKDAIEGHRQPHIYLHCSAGIHRTGFMAYVLLRLMGHQAGVALEKLAGLREVTFDQVGDERIELAEAFAIGILAS